jgi:predicted dehydrogenase
MNKIKIGIIGVGHLGKLHTKLYKEIDIAELVGIYDIDYSKAKQAGEELGVDVYENREKLLDKVDAVSIVTPTTNHKETAVKALNCNCHLKTDYSKPGRS